MSDVSIIVACCEIQHRRRVFGARPKLATASNAVPAKRNPARNSLSGCPVGIENLKCSGDPCNE
jgi:hypothetical protein